MSWSTELFCNISYNRETFNSKYEVKDKLNTVNKYINDCKKTLRDLAIMTEPNKFFNDNPDLDPYNQITINFEDTIELLEEYYIEKYKLLLLLDNWEKCHNKEGLAIYPPDNIDWNTAYLHGDFVKSTKYPTDKDLL